MDIIVTIVSLRVPYTQCGFLSSVACFWSCSCSQKNEVLASSLFFQVFPWHSYFMRGHSLVELTEHDDSAANIIVHSMYCTVVVVVVLPLALLFYARALIGRTDGA